MSLERSAELAGRTALVTGAARGIGAAVAEELVAAGCAVVVADLDPGLAKETADRLHELGPGSATPAEVDIADADSVARLIAGIPPIDILVNNAGIDVIGPFLDSGEDVWARLVQVNLLGTIRCSR